ncbi:MAG: alpha/beta hydrolase [Actinomycetota bacterium]|nr:alpha/beta hydrolase [Actinomycetota bacterium]
MPKIELNGVEISFEERGSGEPLLFLHGWNSSRNQWMHNLKAMTPGFRALAPDLPGFGDSGESEAYPYTLDGLAHFVEDFRKALHLPSLNLVGHSMGGCIALRYTGLYGERVGKLVLVSTPTTRYSLGLRNLIPGAKAFLSITYRFRSEKMLMWMFYRSLYKPEYQDLDFVRANVKAASHIPRHVLTATAGMVREVKLEDDLRGVDLPTLIVFGDRDRSVSTTEVGRQRELLSRPYVAVISSCAHCPPFERPELFNHLVKDFLQEETLG